MSREEFREKRITRRRELLEKIISVFIPLRPISIHLFGSGVTGFKDEFSDIDIWITFEDDKISAILPKLSNIFKDIAPFLINHHSRSWSPVGGSSNSIIHDTQSGPLLVDYYVSKHSTTVIPKDSKVLFGDDSLRKGKWILNKDVNKNIHDTHTLRTDIALLIDLIFISSKGIVRKWETDDFINTLRKVHKEFRKRYPGMIKRRKITMSFRSNYRLLSDLYRIANKSQRGAILKIRSYTKQVEDLY